MAENVYKANCAVIEDWFFEIYTRLTANGYTSTGGSWSDGTTRVANAGPASAANLSANNSYFMVRFGGSGRWIGVQRLTASTANVTYTSADGTLSGTSATVMPSDATFTKTWLSAAQIYPTSGATATKSHTVVIDTTGAFISILRRTPHPGITLDGCAAIMLDIFVPQTWAANPDPAIGCAKFSNGDLIGGVISGYSGGAGLMSGWYKKGIGGAAYNTNWWFDLSRFLGCTTTADAGGVDVDFELKWLTEGSFGFGGKSTLIRGLQPFRSPVTGIDSGGTLTRAAFGTISVLNDGVALAS